MMIFTYYFLLLDIMTWPNKKKSLIFINSFHCPTRRQVPPVLKSIFIFRTLTPNKHSTLRVTTYIVWMVCISKIFQIFNPEKPQEHLWAKAFSKATGF